MPVLSVVFVISVVFARASFGSDLPGQQCVGVHYYRWLYVHIIQVSFRYSQNVGCVYRLLKDRNAPKKAKQDIHQTTLKYNIIFGSECWILTKRRPQQITTTYMKVNRMIQGVTIWEDKKEKRRPVYRQSNMLPIAKVINNNTLRWFGHATTREEK